MKEPTRVLLAVALAIAAGTAIAASGSASLVRAADFLAPIGTLWVNAIRMTVMPLVLFTMLLALAIARTSASARTTLVNFFHALAEAMLMLVRWVILVAPVGVFALVLPLAAHAGASIAGAIGFYILAYSAGCLI